MTNILGWFYVKEVQVQKKKNPVELILLLFQRMKIILGHTLPSKAREIQKVSGLGLGLTLIPQPGLTWWWLPRDLPEAGWKTVFLRQQRLLSSDEGAWEGLPSGWSSSTHPANQGGRWVCAGPLLPRAEVGTIPSDAPGTLCAFWGDGSVDAVSKIRTWVSRWDLRMGLSCYIILTFQN